MSTNAQLDGNEPSWYNKENNSDHYTTNFGGVEITRDTQKMIDCCIGLGRNQYNTQMSIKIFDGEFQISRDTFNTIFAELCSPEFPYKKGTKQVIEISDVLRMLQKDDNFSVAAIAVKKELIWLMVNKLHFTKEDRQELGKLLKIWRQPITKDDLKPTVKRTPIIKRTPILTI